MVGIQRFVLIDSLESWNVTQIQWVYIKKLVTGSAIMSILKGEGIRTFPELYLQATFNERKTELCSKNSSLFCSKALISLSAYLRTC